MPHKLTKKSNVTTNHYFFETFNFFEKENNDTRKAQFLCFDVYGEKMNVRSLLDLQIAFFENISQLK